MPLVRVMIALVGLFLAACVGVTLAALQDTRARIEALEAARSLATTRHGLIEYTEWGEGPPVLVVHGAGGGFDQAQLLAGAIGGARFHWIAVSRFGCLGSPLPPSPSTAEQADAFADLLDALGVHRVSILAMSGGVPPSLQFATRYPDRVDRLVLASSAPFTPFTRRGGRPANPNVGILGVARQ